MANSGSSNKAHNGSANGKTSSHASKKSKDHHSQHTVERYIQDARDVRSYAVKEYDPYQAAEKKQHREKLKEVVKKTY